MSSVQYNFELLIKNQCADDYFTLTSQKQDFTQVIYPVDQGAGNQFGKTHVGPTAVTQADATCSSLKQHTLEVYNDITKVWIDFNLMTPADKAANYPFIQNYASLTAEFDVLFTSDLGSSWDGKSVTMRIKTTDPESAQPGGTVYDQFNVTFKY